MKERSQLAGAKGGCLSEAKMSSGEVETNGAEGVLLHSGLGRASETLRLLSHPQRLLVLCHLSAEGELSVGELLERVELGASALSQHLAKLREEGLVVTRKERQMVYYRIGREDIGSILELLHRLYCEEVGKRD